MVTLVYKTIPYLCACKEAQIEFYSIFINVIHYIALLSLQLASRQGLRRTLISATRKWLGGGRQLNNISPGTHNAISSSLGSVTNRMTFY